MSVLGSFLLTFVLVTLSMAAGRFVRENPLLFGFKAASMSITSTTNGSSSSATTDLHNDHTSSFLSPATIITSHPVLDAVLKHHEADFIVDGDYEAYRNHCLRVMNFAVYYHGIEQPNCQSSASPPPSSPNYNPEKTTAPTTAVTAPTSSMTDHELDVVALAVAYHDIGLWTPNGGALSYLDPSVTVMEQESYVAGQKKNKKQHAWMVAASLPAFTRSDLATAREIILQHHKFTAWQPPQAKVKEKEHETTTPNAVVAALVNAVRRADWCDATMGVVRGGGGGLSAVYLETVYHAIPALGFHYMLLGISRRLSPHSLLGQLDILKILKW